MSMTWITCARRGSLMRYSHELAPYCAVGDGDSLAVESFHTDYRGAVIEPRSGLRHAALLCIAVGIAGLGGAAAGRVNGYDCAGATRRPVGTSGLCKTRR